MSSPSISQARTWSRNSHTLSDAASALDGKVDEFDKAMNGLIRDVDSTMDGWKGDAASASQAAADSEKQISNRLGMGILQITDAINALAPALAHACDAAVRTADYYTALGYLVADNGMVSPPPGAKGGFPTDIPAGLTQAEAAPVAAANAARHQVEIAGKLAAAGQADAALAEKVSEAANALNQAADRATSSVPVSPHVQAILDGRAQVPTDPTQLNRFWNTLTANEKAELWNHDRNVGNMDGVPAADRDHFNRRNLIDMQRQADDRVEELAGKPPGGSTEHAPIVRNQPGKVREWEAWKKEYDAAKTRVDNLQRLDEKMTDPSKPPLYLLSARENGQVAVAVGNPDGATDVSTFVPGTGTNLSSIGGNVDRAHAMVESAGIAGSPNTSVIVWQDYQAPQSVIKDAPFVSYAQHAAGNLDQFQNGLVATHYADTPAHQTVIGHSYGTTVVGQAASGGHTLNADDVVLVASPGLGGPENVGDLQLTGVDSKDMGSHVWESTAAQDPIGGAGDFVLGTDPDAPHFGARHFDSDYGLPWYDEHSKWGFANHSAYWDDDSKSLASMGRIIAGKEMEPR